MRAMLQSDSAGVLAGPLVQMAAGGKPSIEGLADPLSLLHGNSTPGPAAAPAAPAPPSAAPSPALSSFSAANNAADAAQRNQLYSARLATIMGSPSTDTGQGSPSYG